MHPRTPFHRGFLALSLLSGGISAQTFTAQPFTDAPVPTSATLAVAAMREGGTGWSWTGMGPIEADMYLDGLRQKFQWKTPYESAFEWRWQVSLQPFPEAWALTEGLLAAEGKVTGHPFEIDFGDFPPLGHAPQRLPGATSAGPMVAKPVTPVSPGTAASPGRGPTPRASAPAGTLVATPVFPKPFTFYVRLVPTTNGKLAGPPSSVVVLHYQPVPDPIKQSMAKSFEAAAAEQAFDKSLQVYTLSLLHFRPASFEKEYRWGCVEVLENPYLGTVTNGNVPHPLSSYGKGEYCPPIDPAYQQKDTWGYIMLALDGWVQSYQMVSGLWNAATGWVAEQTTGWLCEKLGGDPDSTCEVVTFATDVALKSGLAAVGVPPSMPDLAALEEAAKGDIAAAGADFVCQEAKKKGSECSEEEWKLLETTFGVALDGLQDKVLQQGSEPGCGDTKTAKLHGRKPLPCFTDYPGTKVKPALGAVYEPPVASVEVRRTVALPEPPPSCQVTVSIWLKNHFDGGTIPGLVSAPFPEKDLQGVPFDPQQQVIPALEPGQAVQLKIPLQRIRQYSMTNNGWNPNGTWAEWAALYQGASGGLQLSSGTIEPLLAPGGYATAMPRACGAGTTATIQLPGAP